LVAAFNVHEIFGTGTTIVQALQATDQVIFREWATAHFTPPQYKACES